MFKTSKAALSSKAEATSARILEVALDLFRRKGFEQTTMRGIAAEAGVSLGSAYYYFDSKEDLVMAFYKQAIEAMAPKMEAALAGKISFEERIAALMAVKFEYFQPNRAFLGALFRFLPNLLWLYQMGLILYWIYDRSPDQWRTRALREKSLALLVSSLKLSGFALTKPLRSKIVELIALVEGGQKGA
jgi:AcrR family transcriptional regulator